MLRAGCNGTAENGYLTQGWNGSDSGRMERHLGYKDDEPGESGAWLRSAKSGKPESHSLFGSLK